MLNINLLYMFGVFFISRHIEIFWWRKDAN